MALHTRCLDEECHRAAPPDLHHLPHLIGAGRLAHEANTHRLARLVHPIQKRPRAVHARAFFIACDRQDQRACWRRLAHEINRGRHKRRHARFHILRAAAPNYAIDLRAGEWRMSPCAHIACRHDIRMAIEPEGVRALVTPARKQVRDAAPIHPRAGEPRPGQKPLQQHQRPALNRRDRGAADQLCSQFHRVYGLMQHHGVQIWAPLIPNRSGRGLQPQGVLSPRWLMCCSGDPSSRLKGLAPSSTTRACQEAKSVIRAHPWLRLPRPGARLGPSIRGERPWFHGVAFLCPVPPRGW